MKIRHSFNFSLKRNEVLAHKRNFRGFLSFALFLLDSCL